MQFQQELSTNSSYPYTSSGVSAAETVAHDSYQHTIDLTSVFPHCYLLSIQLVTHLVPGVKISLCYSFKSTWRSNVILLSRSIYTQLVPLKSQLVPGPLLIKPSNAVKLLQMLQNAVNTPQRRRYLPINTKQQHLNILLLQIR